MRRFLTQKSDPFDAFQSAARTLLDREPFALLHRS
jgi:hypothetical protein